MEHIRFVVSPYTISEAMVNVTGAICEQVGKQEEGKRLFLNSPGYSLPKEIRWMNPNLTEDLQRAYRSLEKTEATAFRKTNDRAYPSAEKIPMLVEALLQWAKEAAVHPLIKSAVVHYELLYIHPFPKDNEVMASVWQMLLLRQWKPQFVNFPADAFLQGKQEEYQRKLLEADRSKDSGVFIEYLLDCILEQVEKNDSVEEPTKSFDTVPPHLHTESERRTSTKKTGKRSGGKNGMTQEERIERFLDCLGEETLSAKEIMHRLGMNHLPTFRSNYLHPVLNRGLVERTIPEKPNSSHQKYRKSRKLP